MNNIECGCCLFVKIQGWGLSGKCNPEEEKVQKINGNIFIDRINCFFYKCQSVDNNLRWVPISSENRPFLFYSTNEKYIFRVTGDDKNIKCKIKKFNNKQLFDCKRSIVLQSNKEHRWDIFCNTMTDAVDSTGGSLLGNSATVYSSGVEVREIFDQPTGGEIDWKLPSGVNSVLFTIYGAGGAGGGNDLKDVDSVTPGGGGGSGGYQDYSFNSLFPGETFQLYVGKGGEGVVGGKGLKGEDSYIILGATTVISTGGEGGNVAKETSRTNPLGGVGGIPCGENGEAKNNDSVGPLTSTQGNGGKTAHVFSVGGLSGQPGQSGQPGKIGGGGGAGGKITNSSTKGGNGGNGYITISY